MRSDNSIRRCPTRMAWACISRKAAASPFLARTRATVLSTSCSHCHSLATSASRARSSARYLAEFDFRYNSRVALGVNDDVRVERALKGVKGKRLTYRTTAGRRRSEARAEPEAPPF
jgi:hypothetical protein